MCCQFVVGLLSGCCRFVVVGWRFVVALLLSVIDVLLVRCRFVIGLLLVCCCFLIMLMLMCCFFPRLCCCGFCFCLWLLFLCSDLSWLIADVNSTWCWYVEIRCSFGVV